MKQITLKNIISCMVTLSLNCLVSSHVFAGETKSSLSDTLSRLSNSENTESLLTKYNDLKRDYHDSESFSTARRLIEGNIINIYEVDFFDLLNELTVTLDTLKDEYNDNSDTLVRLENKLNALMTDVDDLVKTMYSVDPLGDMFSEIDKGTEYFDKFNKLAQRAYNHLST